MLKDTDGFIWVRADDTSRFVTSNVNWVIRDNQVMPYYVAHEDWFTMHDISVEEQYVFMRLDTHNQPAYYICASREWWDEQQRN